MGDTKESSEHLPTKVARLTKQLGLAQSQVVEKDEKISTLEAKIHRLSQQLTESRRKYKNMHEKYNYLSDKYNSLQKRLQTIELDKIKLEFKTMQYDRLPGVIEQCNVLLKQEVQLISYLLQQKLVVFVYDVCLLWFVLIL